MMRVFRRLRSVRQLFPIWLRYLVTAGAVFLAAGIWMSLPHIQLASLFLVFIPVIILAGLLFNRGSGLLAASLSILLLVWFLPPRGRFQVAVDLHEPMLFFAVTAISLAAALEALQTAIKEAIRRQDELGAAIVELERSRAWAVESEQRKETLLRELSHRMQNDLANIVGLLRVQARAHPDASAMLNDAAYRVQVLSKVHARLAQRDGEVVVNIAEFLRELGDDLKVSRLGDRSIALDVHASDAFLPVTTASALGLIANELVTNAAKYAFPAGAGAIKVIFETQAPDFVIKVEDDGVGFDEQQQQEGLGTRIIDNLTRQLNGTLTRTNMNPGTCVSVSFPMRRLEDDGQPA